MLLISCYQFLVLDQLGSKTVGNAYMRKQALFATFDCLFISVLDLILLPSSEVRCIIG
jgi:hypothetical protein